jgi:hypothetical protein
MPSHRRLDARSIAWRSRSTRTTLAANSEAGSDALPGR